MPVPHRVVIMVLIDVSMPKIGVLFYVFHRRADNSLKFVVLFRFDFHPADIKLVKVNFGTDNEARIEGNVVIGGEMRHRTYFLKIGYGQTWIWAKNTTGENYFMFDEKLPGLPPREEECYFMVYVEKNEHGSAPLKLIYHKTFKFSCKSNCGF